MATRSRIAIENEDGTVTSIYCHWDGYVDHNGMILQEHYNERSKVEALIALGDISYLDANTLRMLMYLELSRPRGEVSRWPKYLNGCHCLMNLFPLNPVEYGIMKRKVLAAINFNL